MSNNKNRRNLPVPLDLPEPVTQEREQELAPARYAQWRNIASQQHIRNVAVDPDGMVWLATAGGVLRWSSDMAHFTRYASEHGLPGNAVMAIAADGSGLVWTVNERAQLSYLDEESWSVYEWLDDPVHCLSVDHAGRLWVVTAREVIAIDNPKDQPTKKVSTPHTRLPTRALAVGDQGDLWLCNAVGVYHRDGHHDGNKWPPPHEIRGVFALARQGSNLWLGTGSGLLRINLETGEKSEPDRWPRGHVTALLPTADGVWAAIGGQVGLATEKKHVPRHSGWDAMPKRFRSHITGLAFADYGELWIATHAGLASGGPFAIEWYHTESPPDAIVCTSQAQSTNRFSNMVQALALQQDSSHSFLWIGTAGGLFRLHLAQANNPLPSDESWLAYSRPPLQDVRALAVAGNNDEPWVASWDKGLHGLKTPRFGKKVRTVPNAILSLTMGTGSECWAVVALEMATTADSTTAQAAGLYHYDGSAWSLALPTSQLHAENLLQNGAWMQTVAPTPDGHLWLGTSAGLLRYDPTSDDVETVNSTLGLICALLLLPDDTLCVASKQRLYLGVPSDLKLVSGMEKRRPTALAWDAAAQALWVGTHSGLVRLSCHEHSWTIQEEFNTDNSGLGANFVTTLLLQVCEDGQKHLWIGTPCGLSRYCY